jgi:phenylalanine-4-hydroxylase
MIDTPAGLRAYGAGILSSAGELRYSVCDPKPPRVGFELKRLMRSRYRIDTYQATYFVIDSFDQLFEATAPDFTPVYREVRAAIARDGEIEPGVVLPGERLYPVRPVAG